MITSSTSVLREKLHVISLNMGCYLYSSSMRQKGQMLLHCKMMKGLLCSSPPPWPLFLDFFWLARLEDQKCPWPKGKRPWFKALSLFCHFMVVWQQSILEGRGHTLRMVFPTSQQNGDCVSLVTGTKLGTCIKYRQLTREILTGMWCSFSNAW